MFGDHELMSSAIDLSTSKMCPLRWVSRVRIIVHDSPYATEKKAAARMYLKATIDKARQALSRRLSRCLLHVPSVLRESYLIRAVEAVSSLKILTSSCMPQDFDRSTS